MQKLRNQIVESFFNPLHHFLPLLIFVITRNVWGINLAWKIAFAANIILLIYIYFRHKRLIDWFLISTALFLFISTIISLLPLDKFNLSFHHFSGEFVVVIFFTVSLLLRKYIEKLLINISPRNISMVNNLDELFRLMLIFTIVFITYILIDSLLEYIHTENFNTTHEFVYGVYVSSVIFILIYEIIRVTLIRIRLLKEEWWPIVNDKGKSIGSIHHLTSLTDEKKYMHPIIRVMLIDKNKIYLQKRSEDDLEFPGMWDTAISNHVKLNEKIEHCIVRTALERYGIKEIKPIFLSHYIHETDKEFHYAYIFVACKNDNLKPNSKYIEHTKWWTMQQIDENLNSGIFSENFIAELSFLKRSGLVELGNCQCECMLKDILNSNMMSS